MKALTFVSTVLLVAATATSSRAGSPRPIPKSSGGLTSSDHKAMLAELKVDAR